MEKPFLGVIADDYTGATDIASMLVRGGMRTIQTIGIPSQNLAKSLHADAVVIALKSRSIALDAAVAQSLRRWHVCKRSGRNRSISNTALRSIPPPKATSAR